MQGQNTKVFKIVIIIIVAIFLFIKFGGGIILNIVDMLDGKENGPSGLKLTITKDAFISETRLIARGFKYAKLQGEIIPDNGSFLSRINEYSKHPNWFKAFYIISLDPAIVCSTAADVLDIDNYTIKIDETGIPKTYKNYDECINDN